MAIVEPIQELPPTLTADGTITISGTRVSLDSVVLKLSPGRDGGDSQARPLPQVVLTGALVICDYDRDRSCA